MNKLDKATKVLSKLGEAAHWIGAVGCLVGIALTVFMGEKAVVFGAEDFGRTMTVYGFEMEPVSVDGVLSMVSLRLFLVFAAILMALMAMVFRNIHLILKNSEGTTPFQSDNVRMVREIGIFLIAQPVVGLIGSIVARLILGVDAVESSISISGLVVGLVVLCLSRIFARGMELESDVDGLV